MSKLLMEYIRLVVESARTPQQLLSPDDSGVEDTADGSDTGDRKPEEVVDEFSGVAGALGGGGGYTLPLGMSPDDAGRKKETMGRKKRRK